MLTSKGMFIPADMRVFTRTDRKAIANDHLIKEAIGYLDLSGMASGIF